MDSKFRSRKFGLAVAFAVSTILGLFLKVLDGGEFLGAMAIILGMYNAADVSEKKVLMG